MIASFLSDDLVHNRFDLFFDDIKELTYNYNGLVYKIICHRTDKSASLNIWGKVFPQPVIEQCIRDVFRLYPQIIYICVVRAGNNYKNLLYRSNNIFIFMPTSSGLLMQRLKKKHRYNLRRERRLLEEATGVITTEICSRDYISDELVEQYFEWKKKTHGVEYGLSAKEYLATYHVTHAMLLLASSKLVGVVFYCKINATVYLENFAYDYNFKKYSIGGVQYQLFLEKMIDTGVRIVFLGGGGYEYKKYFGSIDCNTYSGKIYSPYGINLINNWIKKIAVKNVAIYGFGAMGRAFLSFSEKLNINVCYAIDAKQIEDKYIKVYNPQDILPKVDAIFIAMKKHDENVEKLLKSKFNHVYYVDDFAKLICEE